MSAYSVAIIGGSDGPTAIWVAGNVRLMVLKGLLTAAAIIAIIVFLVHWRKK